MNLTIDADALASGCAANVAYAAAISEAVEACLEDQGNLDAAKAVAMGIAQVYLLLRPLQLAAIDLEVEAAASTAR